MNPFVSRFRQTDQKWILPMTVMCFVLGFMISIARVTETNRNSRYRLLEPTQKTRVTEAAIDIDAYHQLTVELNKLRSEKTKLENAIGKGTSQTQLLNESLQETKIFAGLQELEGPGIRITLKDSSRGGMQVNNQTVFTPDSNIHDIDVLRIVNELFSAGAEAVSVNDHRISGPSSFRCVGPTILVNDVKIASPIVISAIGDTKTLVGGVNLNGGILSEIRSSDPTMVVVEPLKYLKVPAFAGRTNFKVAKVPKESK